MKTNLLLAKIQICTIYKLHLVVSISLSMEIINQPNNKTSNFQYEHKAKIKPATYIIQLVEDRMKKSEKNMTHFTKETKLKPGSTLQACIHLR